MISPCPDTSNEFNVSPGPSPSSSTTGSDSVPQGNRLDFAKLNLPFKNLLDLAFIWTLFHLLSTNQVEECWGQDQITFHRLWTDRIGSF